MDRKDVERQLALATARVQAADKLVRQQRHILSTIADLGLQAEDALRLLETFEISLALHIQERDRLAAERTGE